MNISSLSATYTLTEQLSYSTSSSTQGTSQTDDSQASPIAPQKARHGGHNNGIFKSFLDTLQQMGLVPNGTSLAQNGSVTASTTTSTGTDSNAGPNAETIQQDMQAFMHALFQALHAQSAKQTSTTSNDASQGKVSGQYGSFESRIAQLAQSLGSDSTGSGSGSGANSPSDLDSAFQQLIRDLNTARQDSATAKQPSLQSFLQSWAANMSQSGANSTLGNRISIAA